MGRVISRWEADNTLCFDDLLMANLALTYQIELQRDAEERARREVGDA